MEFIINFKLLEEIDMSHNALTQFSPKYFENLPGLRESDISHNQIASIHRIDLATKLF